MITEVQAQQNPVKNVQNLQTWTLTDVQAQQNSVKNDTFLTKTGQDLIHIKTEDGNIPTALT
jgi:hypothetical protein